MWHVQDLPSRGIGDHGGAVLQQQLLLQWQWKQTAGITMSVATIRETIAMYCMQKMIGSKFHLPLATTEKGFYCNGGSGLSLSSSKLEVGLNPYQHLHAGGTSRESVPPAVCCCQEKMPRHAVSHLGRLMAASDSGPSVVIGSHSKQQGREGGYRRG